MRPRRGDRPGDPAAPQPRRPTKHRLPPLGDDDDQTPGARAVHPKPVGSIVKRQLVQAKGNAAEVRVRG